MTYIIHKLIEFTKKHPYAVAFNTILTLTSPIDDVFIPYLMGRIVSNVQNKGNWKRPLIATIVILIAMQVFYTSMLWHDAYLLPKAQTYIHESMVSDIVKRHEGTDVDFKMGEIMARLVKIPETATDSFQMIKNYIIPYFISFAITIATVTYYDKYIGLSLLVSSIIVLAIVTRSPFACLDPAAKYEKSQSQIAEETEDLLQNITSVYTTDNISKELTRLERFYRAFEQSYASMMDCIVRNRFKAIVVLAAMLAFFAYRSITGIKNRTLEIGAFVTVIGIVSQYFTILGWLSSMMRESIMNYGIINAFENVQKELDQHVASVANTTHLPPSQPTSSTLPLPNAVISVRNLDYVIKSRYILRDFNIDIMPNERLAIIGEIGSGKSTFIKLLLGLKRPTNGQIYIRNTPHADIPKRQLYKIVSYVPQHPILFNRPIIDNIKYGVPNIDDAAVVKMINELGLANALLLPTQESDGLKALAGKGGSNLSGGQRQIIACMRALLANTPIIILDEITSAIDKGTKALLFKVLEKLFVEKTVIMITHDQDLLALATRTIVMKHQNKSI